MPPPTPDAAPARAPARPRTRLAKLAVIMLATFAALILALPLAVRQAIGPDRLKELTEQALTDALGRPVTVAGGVSVTLRPWLGLTMGPVTVANAPGFGDSPMLTAGRLDMTIRMLPLLVKVVSPGSVRVRDVEVSLVRRADGRANWDDLTAPKDASTGWGWTVAPQPRDIRLENITARFDNAATGRSLAVTGANLRTGLGQPFNFSASFTADGLAPDTSLECHLQGQASFDAGTGRIGVHHTKVETGLVAVAPLVPGGATPARVVSRFFLDYDPGAAVLTVSDIDARAPGLRLTGSATASDLPDAPQLRTELKLAADMDGHWLDLLGLARPDAPESLVSPDTGGAPRPDTLPETTTLRSAPPPPGQAEAALTATVDAAGVTLERLDIRLPRGTIQATARASLGTAPRLTASVTAEGVPFETLPRPLTSSGLPVPGPWIFGRDLDVQATVRNCSLGTLPIANAAATLRGSGGLARIYPASVVLPGGSVASLDVRLAATGGPDGGPGCEVTAVVDPAGTKATFSGRLDPTGAAGAWTLASPDPAKAAKALGIDAQGLPAGLPIEAKGQVTWLPGQPAKCAVTGLEAKIAGTALRGQFGYGTLLPAGLSFDLSVDSLDLDRLASALPASGQATGNGALPRARGRLRLDQLTGRGIEARNAALDLTLGAGSLTAAVEGAELSGGKLTGTVERQPSGRLTAALQLAGAEAGKLFAKTGLTLSGPVTAKAAIEAGGAANGRPGTVTATFEAESSQLSLTRNGQRLPLAAPKATLSVKGADGPDGFDGDATLTLVTAGANGGAATLGLRDIKATLTGPVALDRSGRLRDGLQGKLDAQARIRPPGAPKDIPISLAGPVAMDGAGGFTAGELACDIGGAKASAKIWRKAGDGSPTQFSLDGENLQPRQLLPAWGVALPAQVPADRLTKAGFAASGTVDDKSITVSKLAASLDDSHLTGHGVIDRYDPARGKWDLSIDRLDCDAYFPSQPASGPPPPAELRKPLDYQGLRNLALDAKVHFGWLKKGNVTFDASNLTVMAKGGLFTFRNESPRFYGGRLFTEVRGDARDTALKTMVELKLEGIEIARFLRDWAEGDTLASGTCTFVVAARTSGASEEALRGNLAGNGSLQVTRGELKVRDHDHPSGGKPSEERIPFDIFSSTWTAHAGVAHSDDFRIESPRMLITGKGQVDLRDETINLSLLATLANGAQAPATIIGPLDGPKVTIDRSRIIGDVVYRMLQGFVSIPGRAVTRILQLPIR